MKKRYVLLIIVLLLIIVVAAIAFMAINQFTYDKESLGETHVSSGSITIIGDYLFYVDRASIPSITKAKNLKTGETNFFGIGDKTPALFADNYLYYSANKSFKVGNVQLYRRNINNFSDEKLTDDAIQWFTLYDNYLYYQKFATVGEDDFAENGYIFRINLDTKEKEPILKCDAIGVQFCNNSIYYLPKLNNSYDKYNEIVSDGIYCYSLADNTSTIITKGLISDFSLENEIIAFSEFAFEENNTLEKTYSLKTLNLNTGEIIKLCDNVIMYNGYDGSHALSFDLNDSNIYYIDNNLLNTINIYDCSHKQTKSINANEDVKMFRVFGDNLCYVEDSNLKTLHVYNVSDNSSIAFTLDDFDIEQTFVLHKSTLYYYDFKGNLHEKLLDM